jgi:hypothetical protein
MYPTAKPNYPIIYFFNNFSQEPEETGGVGNRCLPKWRVREADKTTGPTLGARGSYRGRKHVHVECEQGPVVVFGRLEELDSHVVADEHLP